MKAYRAWALAQPQRYAMLFGIPGDDPATSTESINVVHGGMLVLLRLLAEISADQPPPGKASKLDNELLSWSARRDDENTSPLVLRLGVLTWTRLHGIVSLELAGVFEDMGIDAQLLLDDETEAIVVAAAP